MRTLGNAFVLVLAAGLAGPPVLSAQSGTVIPVAIDEQGLWTRAAEEEAIIMRSGFVMEDPQLDAYLQAVTARLAEVDGLEGDVFVVTVLKDTSLNAFAFPNGHLFVHSGLLARMTNEAQIGSVLGHEMTHVVNRHAWKSFRSLKTKTGLLATVGAASVTAGDFQGLAQLLGEVGTMAAVSGYSRTLEREADEAGWHRLAGAGYDTHEAPEAFRLLMADLDAHGRKEPFFFGSHPRLLEREKNFQRLNAAQPKGPAGEKGENRFAEAILPVLLINGELEMRAGRHDAARDQLWRYRAARPAEARVRWLLGENERLDKSSGDLKEARTLLNEAIALDPEFAPPYRSLGLICFRAGELPAAAVHFRRFLDLEPAAQDRAYLEQYLQKCEPASSSPSQP